ncbi:hypothetical protein [Streptomyces sp. NPDC055036]
MPLRRTMPMGAGTRPDPKQETTYQASRGGHFPPPEKPVAGTPKKGR